MILLIGGEKGGVGKSTIACNLSAYLAHLQKDVLLVDADPQKSSSIWASRRREIQNIPKVNCVEKTGNICETITDFAKRYEYIIIDTGGRDSKELRSGLLVSNIFYTPIKPNQMDIDTLSKMNELVEYALSINNSLKAYSIITHAPTNPSMNDIQEANAILEIMPNFKPSKITIKYRSSYWRSMGQGISILEYNNDYKAEKEIKTLGQEIFSLKYDN